MKIRPVGFHVLVELDKIEQVSEGGIVMSTPKEHAKEKGAHDIGRILAFGPLAFKGYEQCDGPKDWGVKIGDLVEFRRYDGKIPHFDTELVYRLINDQDIIAVINYE